MTLTRPETIDFTAPDAKPPVSVWCVVYNHGPYLRQCLDSLVGQKTTFGFEIIVHDDCSTDDSAEIIREYARRYPKLIRVVLECENQYSKGDHAVSSIMMSMTRGQYVAYCEGDDYWSDPLKLQLQYSAMTARPELGLVYTMARKYYQAQSRLSEPYGGPSTSFAELLLANTVPTVSIMVKKRVMLRYFHEIIPSGRGWKMGDYPLLLWAAAKSKIGFMPRPTSVYRVLTDSASHSSDPVRAEAFTNSYYDIKDHFASLFMPAMLKRLEQERTEALMRKAFSAGDLKKVRKLYRQLRNPSLKSRIRRLAVCCRLTWKLSARYLVRD